MVRTSHETMQFISLCSLLVLARLAAFTHGCQLPSEWRPLSEGCRAELAEIIVYARVLAIHRETVSSVGGLYNSLPFGLGYGYESVEEGLLYSAEVELLCDQAWGSMLEVPTGSRLNLTGLGYLSCQSHTVMENYSYFFFLRMDENYNLLPHAVNFQDAIFLDSPENRRSFSSLFQFSNCSVTHPDSSMWDLHEDSRLMCSSVQSALFEEEEKTRHLEERLSASERRNRQLRERLKKVKRSLKNARKAALRADQEKTALQERLRRAGEHDSAVSQSQPSRTQTHQSQPSRSQTDQSHSSRSQPDQSQAFNSHINHLKTSRSQMDQSQSSRSRTDQSHSSRSQTDQSHSSKSPTDHTKASRSRMDQSQTSRSQTNQSPPSRSKSKAEQTQL